MPRLRLALLVATLACAGPRAGEPAANAVSLPREARGGDQTTGWELPLAARGSERHRCVDRELAARDLNPFGDPQGTSYPTGAPLEITEGTDRLEYVLRRHRGIAAQCSRAPGEPDR